MLDLIFTELCSELFASLSRRDQRRKGMEYLRGLLDTPGRKSIRNIASRIGGRATEQSLHHFISDSTWDWAPVRRALARYVARHAPPQAWVVQPVVIPKAGEHSVGVSRRFCPTWGQAVNAQQAVGVWAASPELTSPVNWRLHLSQSWLEDRSRRNRVSIPDGMCAETLGDCAVEAYLETAAQRELPVVLDAREISTTTIMRRLRALGAPFLVRIDSTFRLIAADPGLPGHSTDLLPAHQIIGAARESRRPVPSTDHGPVPAMRTMLAAAVRVTMPTAGCRQRGQGELLLLGAGRINQSWPTELWLTDLTDAEPAALLRVGGLIRKVGRDFANITDQVGIRDYAGRSFTGWHRHVTLASAAHAITAFTDTTGREVGHAS